MAHGCKSTNRDWIKKGGPSSWGSGWVQKTQGRKKVAGRNVWGRISVVHPKKWGGKTQKSFRGRKGKETHKNREKGPDKQGVWWEKEDCAGGPGSLGGGKGEKTNKVNVK